MYVYKFHWPKNKMAHTRYVAKIRFYFILAVKGMIAFQLIYYGKWFLNRVLVLALLVNNSEKNSVNNMTVSARIYKGISLRNASVEKNSKQ